MQRTKADREYEVRDAMQTLARAEQIKKDKALMSQVKKSAADMQKAIASATKKSRK